MIHRAIAAALLAGLSVPALAQQRPNPAYDQAAGLASGRSADAAYDGSTVRAAVQPAVPGAYAAAKRAEPPSPVAAFHAATLETAVPVPAAAPAEAPFYRISAPQPAGAPVAPLAGGPIGAAVGTVAGLSIGFALSKLLS